MINCVIFCYGDYDSFIYGLNIVVYFFLRMNNSRNIDNIVCNIIRIEGI